jgi:cytochrome c oxidase subunit IV
MANHVAEHQAEHHLVPVKYYIGVFLLLMVLTVLTVIVASFDLEHIWGPLNIVLALTIAVIKATAVVLIFMHVRWSSRLTQVILVAGIFWLFILLTFTMADYGVRLHNGWPTSLGQNEKTAP